MKIEVFMNKETSLVIDDIGRSIEEDGILKEGYLKAIRAFKRYAEQTKQIRVQLEKSDKSASQVNDILYQSPHNIIAFSGRRGTGKTSAMISFSEFLKNQGKQSSLSEKQWKENFEDLHTLVLSPIDPTMLENDQDILSVVLSRLLYKSEERWNRNQGFHRQVQNLDKEKNDLLRKANACMNGIQAVKKKGDIKSLSDLQRVGDSAVLKKNLFDLVDMVNSFCLGVEFSKAESSYLVIPIDDTDCQIQKGHEVMEDIRRYLTLPNVLILMATDGDMLRTVFAQHYAAEFKTGLEKQFLDAVHMEHYAEKYLSKLIPGTNRVYLPVFENVLQGNSVNLGLGYYKDESRNEDLISGTIYQKGKQLEEKCACSDIDNKFQAKILSFIYQRTGIVFSEHTAYINNIIPTTMRGLTHLLNFLHSMGEVEKIDYSHAYTAQEFVRVVRKRFENLDRNLDLFEEYFMNEWIPAKVPGDMVAILKGIEEQVPANLIQYAYDEMYDKYVAKDGNDSMRYPRVPEASYYELMQMLGGINGTIPFEDIPKKYKHRQEFYSTFAVCTLLTIKNNKQALKCRLKALQSLNESLKMRTDDDQAWEMDYSSCTISGSLPHRITESNKEKNSKKVNDSKRKNEPYINSLMPVVELFSGLLQDEIGYEEGETSIKKYCMQELSWTVLCNWDVQDMIYKAVESYLNQEMEKTPEGLWEYILDTIAGKNCNMLAPIVNQGKVENISWLGDYIAILKDKYDKEDTPGQKDVLEPENVSTQVTASMNQQTIHDSDINNKINLKINEIRKRLLDKSGINHLMLTEDVRELIQLLQKKGTDTALRFSMRETADPAGSPEYLSWSEVSRKIDSFITTGTSILDTVTAELASPEKDTGTQTKSLDAKTKQRIRSWLTGIERWIKKNDTL